MMDAPMWWRRRVAIRLVWFLAGMLAAGLALFANGRPPWVGTVMGLATGAAAIACAARGASRR